MTAGNNSSSEIVNAMPEGGTGRDVFGPNEKTGKRKTISTGRKQSGGTPKVDPDDESPELTGEQLDGTSGGPAGGKVACQRCRRSPPVESRFFGNQKAADQEPADRIQIGRKVGNRSLVL